MVVLMRHLDDEDINAFDGSKENYENNSSKIQNFAIPLKFFEVYFFFWWLKLNNHNKIKPGAG